MFFFCLTLCSDLKYRNIAWFKAMCLCHNRWCETIGYRYRNSKKRDVWRVEDLFVLLSFQSCVLVCLFSQLPKAVRNINLNIPHIVFIYFCLSNLKRTATVSSSHRNALFGVCTLISRCSSFSPSLFFLFLAWLHSLCHTEVWWPKSRDIGAWEIFFSNVMYMEENKTTSF